MLPVTLRPATCWMEMNMAKKKEKIIWVDDSRTIADMSGVGTPRPGKADSNPHGKPLKAGYPLKEHLKTFFDAMGFMFLPTMAIAGLLALTFFIVYILL